MTPTTTDAAPVTDPVRERPRYTLNQAAKMTGSSESTMKRRLKAGAFPNAARDESGAWMLPVEDLLAAGFHLNSQAPVTDPGQSTLTPTPDPDHALTKRIADLERQLTIEQVRREAAEQIAAEREKRAQTAERALLMLEAAPAAVPVKRRRWWQ